jgi:excisionase family DNA binding protein
VSREHHKATEEEVRAYLRESPESDGPGVLADRADTLYHSLVPPHPPELDYLAGRIALNMEETAAALGLGRSAIRTAIRNGQIPSVMVGSRRLIPIKALERHLEALAYADSGALDAWETALVHAATSRLRRVRRQAWERRKELRRKLRESRRRMDELKKDPGAGREVARDIATQLVTIRAELTAEQALASRAGNDIARDLEYLMAEFGLTEADMEAPRLGLS